MINSSMNQVKNELLCGNKRIVDLCTPWMTSQRSTRTTGPINYQFKAIPLDNALAIFTEIKPAMQPSQSSVFQGCFSARLS